MTVALATRGVIYRKPAELLGLFPGNATCRTPGQASFWVVFSVSVPVDTAVSLSSTDELVATVPASVTVLAGEQSATFDATAVSPGACEIVATHGADESRSNLVVLGGYKPSITTSANELAPAVRATDLKPKIGSAGEE